MEINDSAIGDPFNGPILRVNIFTVNLGLFVSPSYINCFEKLKIVYQNIQTIYKVLNSMVYTDWRELLNYNQNLHMKPHVSTSEIHEIGKIKRQTQRRLWHEKLRRLTVLWHLCGVIYLKLLLGARAGTDPGSWRTQSAPSFVACYHLMRKLNSKYGLCLVK